MSKSLAELEALPEMKRMPDNCMSCNVPMPYGYCEIIVYRAQDGTNVSFEQARNDWSVDEIVTAGVCLDCNEKLYSS